MQHRIPKPGIPFAPRVYHCRRAAGKPVLDGNLDKPFWADAPWTALFVDIEGEGKPAPRFETRAKMLWDEEALYFGAELTGDEIWAHVTRRDDVIFRDNDFEIFIDPDSDTHCYCEFEMNALGTMWDLFLTKPYRDGGIPLNSFDIKGLCSAVWIDGTLNDPAAHNVRWTLEVKMPFESLLECIDQGAETPVAGDFWRVNFSRVQWLVEQNEKGYTKKVNPETGKPFPEDNWVWSPTGVVNMHYPEMWGFVFFTEGEECYAIPEDEQRKWTLRRYYYDQQAHRDAHGVFSPKVLPDRAGYTVEAQVLDGWFAVRCPSADGASWLVLTADGRVTKTRRA